MMMLLSEKGANFGAQVNVRNPWLSVLFYREVTEKERGRLQQDPREKCGELKRRQKTVGRDRGERGRHIHRHTNRWREKQRYKETDTCRWREGRGQKEAERDRDRRSERH